MWKLGPELGADLGKESGISRRRAVCGLPVEAQLTCSHSRGAVDAVRRRNQDGARNITFCKSLFKGVKRKVADSG